MVSKRTRRIILEPRRIRVQSGRIPRKVAVFSITIDGVREDLPYYPETPPYTSAKWPYTSQKPPYFLSQLMVSKRTRRIIRKPRRIRVQSGRIPRKVAVFSITIDGVKAASPYYPQSPPYPSAKWPYPTQKSPYFLSQLMESKRPRRIIPNPRRI